MFACISTFLLLPLVAGVVLAQPKLPETVKQLDGDQIKSLLAGRTAKFVVHDAGVAANG